MYLCFCWGTVKDMGGPWGLGHQARERVPLSLPAATDWRCLWPIPEILFIFAVFIFTSRLLHSLIGGDLVWRDELLGLAGVGCLFTMQWCSGRFTLWELLGLGGVGWSGGFPGPSSQLQLQAATGLLCPVGWGPWC
jgi:hypothetical protein